MRACGARSQSGGGIRGKEKGGIVTGSVTGGGEGERGGGELCTGQTTVCVGCFGGWMDGLRSRVCVLSCARRGLVPLTGRGATRRAKRGVGHGDRREPARADDGREFFGMSETVTCVCCECGCVGDARRLCGRAEGFNKYDTRHWLPCAPG